MMHDIPTLTLPKGVEAFFEQADTLDYHARQRFFYDLFPYAEHIPGSLSLLSTQSEILGCNDYAWKQIRLENITQLIDHTSAEAEALLRWPVNLVGQAMKNDQEVLKTGLSVHEEVIIHGEIEKTLICRKEAIYNQDKKPVGILCLALSTRSHHQKIKVSPDASQVTLSLSHHKSVVLSKREFLTLRMLLQGCTSAEIAHLYSISPKTIETYVKRLKEKLDCEKQRDIIALLLKKDIASAIVNL